ncbi:MAG: pirin family protein [Bacteroidia bacterium]
MNPVLRILPAYSVDMGGIPIWQPLPTQAVDQIDPFLLLHHHSSVVKPGSDPYNSGVGPHPHRGFSPVTFIYQGDVHHRDSRGNSSVVKAGGLQWCDMGMGMVHSERPSAALCEQGGPQEIIQLWVNTPAAHKMDAPVYIALQAADMPSLPGHPQARLASGQQCGIEGPLKSAYPIQAAFGDLEAGVVLELAVAEQEQSFLYILAGSGRIEGHGLVEAQDLVQLKPGAFRLFPADSMRFLWVSAKPIAERVESYGPFVMTNQSEIMAAMRDYQMGKMGFLVERDMA